MNRAMIWPCAVVGLLGMNVAIVGVTVYFAAVNTTMIPEPKYYERAVRYDEHIAQRAANERLGWTATAALSINERGAPSLTVRLFDRHGDAIRDAVVRADAIPNVRPASRAVVELNSAADGGYSGDVASRQGGLWTIRLEARRGGDVFTAEASTRMPGAGGGGDVGGVR